MFERTTTARVRPLSHADIVKIADGVPTGQIYQAMTDGLMPVTFTLFNTSPVEKIVVTEQEGRPERARIVKDQFVGHEARVDIQTHFGSETRDTFYTTSEAQQTALRLGRSSRSERRTYLIADDEGEEMTTVPVYGAQTSLTMFMAGVEATEMLERAQAALRKEFGDDLDIYRPASRPVHDHRVNVYSLDHRLLGVNVLAATATYVANTNAWSTEPVTEGLIVGR